MHQIVEFIEQIIFKNKYESLFIKLFVHMSIAYIYYSTYFDQHFRYRSYYFLEVSEKCREYSLNHFQVYTNKI